VGVQGGGLAEGDLGRRIRCPGWGLEVKLGGRVGGVGCLRVFRLRSAAVDSTGRPAVPWAPIDTRGGQTTKDRPGARARARDLEGGQLGSDRVVPFPADACECLSPPGRGARAQVELHVVSIS